MKLEGSSAVQSDQKYWVGHDFGATVNFPQNERRKKIEKAEDKCCMECFAAGHSSPVSLAFESAKHLDNRDNYTL